MKAIKKTLRELIDLVNNFNSQVFDDQKPVFKCTVIVTWDQGTQLALEFLSSKLGHFLLNP